MNPFIYKKLKLNMAFFTLVSRVNVTINANVTITVIVTAGITCTSGA